MKTLHVNKTDLVGQRCLITHLKRVPYYLHTESIIPHERAHTPKIFSTNYFENEFENNCKNKQTIKQVQPYSITLLGQVKIHTADI